MESKAYEYMDWPRIEAVVYGEEASPKDVMAPRLTTDGVLIQGFFPEADKTEVLVGSRKYEMEQEDEAGYFAAMIPEERSRIINIASPKEKKQRNLQILMHSPARSQKQRKKLSALVFIITRMRNWVHIR